jgi:hypothetical protein
MDEEWFKEQLKKVDAFMQVPPNGTIPADIAEAYHHGVRGIICNQAAKIYLLEQELAKFKGEKPRVLLTKKILDKSEDKGRKSKRCEHQIHGGDCNTCEDKCEEDRSLEGWANIIMKNRKR